MWLKWGFCEVFSRFFINIDLFFGVRELDFFVLVGEKFAV